MSSLVCSDVCGKMEWDTKPSRAGAPLVPVVSQWATGLGTAPAAGLGGDRHQGCGAALQWDLSWWLGLQGNECVNPGMGILALTLATLGGC